MHARLVSIIVLLTLAAPGASAQDWSARVVGRYTGELMSSGDTLPAVTVFRTRSPSVVGDYTFLESGDIEVGGSLDQCTSPRPLILLCRWRDKYGAGWLQMTFTDDLLAFAGEWWNERLPAIRLPWRGRKLARPDA